MGVSPIDIAFFGISFLIGFLFWKNAIRGVLFWILVEGAIRKWVWPSGHVTIYFLKDFLLAGAFVRWGLLHVTPQTRWLSLDMFSACLGIQGIWCLFEIWNPHSPRLLIGLMGLKTYMFYALLAYVIPELFDSKKRLLHYLRWYALSSLPVLVFGIVQFFSPPGSAIAANLGWNPATKITVFGGVGRFTHWVRISGTFAYLTEYSGYLTMLALLVVALIQVRGLKGKISFYVVAALAMINLFMTGSRGPVGLVLGGFALFLAISGRMSFGKFLSLFTRMAWIGAIAALVIAIEFPDAIKAFVARVKFESDLGQRVVWTVEEPWLRMVQAGLVGYGVGTTHPATMFLVGDEQAWESMPRDFEQEAGRVMLETGLVGFLIFYGVRVFLLWALWKGIHRIEDWDLKMIAIFGWLLNLMLISEGVLFSHIHLVFYWFFTGLGLWIPRLEQEKNGQVSNAMPASLEKACYPDAA